MYRCVFLKNVVQDMAPGSMQRYRGKWLLEAQYIKSPLHPGRYWKVVKGAGMGLCFSAAVANACMLNMVDESVGL